ncbi:MAG: hypothetical protein JW957_08240 [Candidatus Omnitrophica bacterium]|nr:hypothetical protein [Candidatus Omnitrophota bacterium]
MTEIKLLLPWMLLWGLISILCIVAIIKAVSSILAIGGKKCPMCKSRVPKNAKICRYCQYKFEDN